MRNVRDNIGELLFYIIATCLLWCLLAEAKAAVVYQSPLQGEELQIGNLLEWSTASEMNSQMFIVERSIDGGSTFENIGMVESSGESAEEKTYRYMDIGITDEKAFYRLKEMDFSGRGSYSQTVLINKVMPNQFSVMYYSNTATEKDFEVTLDAVASGELSYSLVSYKGETVFEARQPLESGINELAINLEDLKEGIYRVNFQMNEELESLVIQKMEDEIKKKPNVASKKQSSKG